MKDYNKSSIIPLKNQDNKNRFYLNNTLDPSRETRKQRTGERMGEMIGNHWPLIVSVTLGVTTTVATWTWQQPPVYQGRFQILLEDPNINQQNSPKTRIDSRTKIEVLKSYSVLQPLLSEIAQQHPDLGYHRLTKGNQAPLTIKPLKRAKIMEVTLEHESPKKISLVLDHLAQSYLLYGKNQENIRAKQGMDFITAQVSQLRQEVTENQQQLQKLRQQYNFLRPEQKSQELSQQLHRLKALDFDTQTRLQEAQTLYDALQKHLGLSPQEAIAASVLSESPRYQNLLRQLQEVEIELAKESARFLEGSPVIEALKEKKANLIPLLKQEALKDLGNQANGQIDPNSSGLSPSNLRLSLQQQLLETANQIRVLQVRKMAIGKESHSIYREIKKMPFVAREYDNLNQKLTTATDSLNRFVAASQQMQIEAISQKTAPWQLITPPEVEKMSIVPKMVQNVSLGSIVGLFLGIGMANVVEVRNQQSKVKPLWAVKF